MGAPTIPPADRGESVPPAQATDIAGEQREKPVKTLTSAALAQHTAKLAKEHADAYAATFATAKSHYSKGISARSIAGKSVNGKSVNGVSINGKSVNGRSVNGRSVNGRSVNGR